MSGPPGRPAGAMLTLLTLVLAAAPAVRAARAAPASRQLAAAQQERCANGATFAHALGSASGCLSCGNIGNKLTIRPDCTWSTSGGSCNCKGTYSPSFGTWAVSECRATSGLGKYLNLAQYASITGNGQVLTDGSPFEVNWAMGDSCTFTTYSRATSVPGFGGGGFGSSNGGGFGSGNGGGFGSGNGGGFGSGNGGGFGSGNNGGFGSGNGGGFGSGNNGGFGSGDNGGGFGSGNNGGGFGSGNGAPRGSGLGLWGG